MTTATDHLFDKTVHATNVWLSELAQELGGGSHERAYLVLRTVVLHALRDRLPIEQAVAFGAQLPMLVRGFYYEGWHPAGKPLRERKKEQFLSHVAAVFAGDPAADAEEMTCAVLRVLEHHITRGEIERVTATLPRSCGQCGSSQGLAHRPYRNIQKGDSYERWKNMSTRCGHGSAGRERP